MTARIEEIAGRRRLVAYQRRSMELSVAQWEQLEQMARQLKTNAIGGTNARRPSWRALVRDLANGKLAVTITKR